MTAPTPPTSTLVRLFTVSISDPEIDDLKQRLARTRWPDPETVGDWSQGVRVENSRSLVDYWERGYDWRRFESELNRFRQFLTGHDCAGRWDFLPAPDLRSGRDSSDPC